jgi:NET1-associated nuclear protein 1 (U3 small nucleolar RNA-associated protein 17)
MVSNTDVNGDTASLKRKRELKDERALAQKKHRRRSASKLQEDAANTIDDSTSRSAVTQQHTSDLELTDASPELNGALVPASFASWKVSKPMGGRMLDIDPVFSPDER